MYPLTWEKNGSFCRNEFQKTIFFGKKSVIFQIKNEQKKYFILIKKYVSRGTDGDSTSLGVFCRLSMSVLLRPLLQIHTHTSDHTVSAHIRVIGLDLWSPRFKESCNVQWNCSLFYWWNWSLERRAVFLQWKIYNIFLGEVESDLLTGVIYKLTLLRKLVKKYDFIEYTFIKRFHFQLKYFAVSQNV